MYALLIMHVRFMRKDYGIYNMNSSKSALAATIFVFLLAVAAAFFAFWNIAREAEDQNDQEREQNSVFTPTEDQRAEMEEAAERLIRNNHELIRLLITRGLPTVPEPYGNPPENGIYYVDSDEYLRIEDIYELIYDTFTEDEAERVKNNRLDNDSFYYSDIGRIYFDKGGRLGITMDFEPNEDFPVSWVNPSYAIVPLSPIDCILRVNLTVDGQNATIQRTMYKLNGHWYIDSFILLD